MEFQRGNLEAAERRAENERLRSGHDANSLWSWKFRLLDAEILLRQRRAREALVLVGAEQPPPPGNELTIKWRVLRAQVNRSLGHRSEFERELQIARQLAESVHSPLMADVLHAEALGQRDRHDLEAAIAGFKASLAVAQRSGDQFLVGLNLVDIGSTTLRTHRYDEALRQSEQAAGFAQAIGDQREFEIAVGNSGWAYGSLGDFEQALARFKAAESAAATIHDTSSQTHWLVDATVASYRLRKFADARSFGERALQLALADPTNVDLIVNLQADLALVLSEQGVLPGAERYSQAALTSAQRSEDSDVRGYALLVHGLIMEHSGLSAAARTDFLAALNLTTDVDVRSEIQNAFAQSYAHEGQSKLAEHWYRLSIQTFEQKRAGVADESLRLSAFALGSGVYGDYAGFLLSQGRSAEALTVLDESRARTLEEGLRVSADATQPGKTLSAEVTASKLNVPILFYSLGPEKSYVWAINAARVRVIPLPGEEQIRALVAQYQRQIARSADPLRDDSAAARSLYKLLIEPVRELIPNGSRVFVIPDGVLYGLNFETLVESTEAGEQYWIESVAITVASSIRLLAHSQTPVAPAEQSHNRSLLLIGDPLAAGAEFEALPNAAREMAQVRGHFPIDLQTVLTQTQAFPGSYAASSPERYSYIHFVAHGTANLVRPLDSAVVLSPNAADASDFKLYAREILEHPLHADLVTVSACYGAGARSYAGEGLVGLAWAFLRAGAHNVIAALWQVDDASTPLLMERFYEGLEKGELPDAALREAKLSFLHGRDAYRKPFYWGTFQLYSGA